MNGLAENLRALRAIRKLSQRQLAIRSGISADRICRAENGQEVTLEFVIAVCEALNYPAWRMIRRVSKGNTRTREDKRRLQV